MTLVGKEKVDSLMNKLLNKMFQYIDNRRIKNNLLKEKEAENILLSMQIKDMEDEIIKSKYNIETPNLNMPLELIDFSEVKSFIYVNDSLVIVKSDMHVSSVSLNEEETEIMEFFKRFFEKSVTYVIGSYLITYNEKFELDKEIFRDYALRNKHRMMVRN